MTTNILWSIENMLSSYRETPLLFAGDLNDVPDSEVIGQLKKNMGNAVTNEKIAPADLPKIQLDYIMYASNKNWKISSTKVLDEKIASDHRPVMAILELVDNNQQ
ncbi:endonuclease/exonuclease/phosphatase family protein [Maribacter sp. 2304DJ31-5]|uniref:endonuclease/exonuclease/phosphatase family protein n=1 Tax=Maribacter sp. 2304DJ31-5 TaxID=3386273 RepID=UPI0039BD72E9